MAIICHGLKQSNFRIMQNAKPKVIFTIVATRLSYMDILIRFKL